LTIWSVSIRLHCTLSWRCTKRRVAGATSICPSNTGAVMLMRPRGSMAWSASEASRSSMSASTRRLRSR